MIIMVVVVSAIQVSRKFTSEVKGLEREADH